MAGSARSDGLAVVLARHQARGLEDVGVRVLRVAGRGDQHLGLVQQDVAPVHGDVLLQEEQVHARVAHDQAQQLVHARCSQVENVEQLPLGGRRGPDRSAAPAIFEGLGPSSSAGRPG